VLTTAELANLALAAEKPGTWHMSPLSSMLSESPSSAPMDRQIPADSFDILKSEVEAASDRERVALALAVTVAVIVVLVSSVVILDSVAPHFLTH
jgi:hypothetical protein